MHADEDVRIVVAGHLGTLTQADESVTFASHDDAGAMGLEHPLSVEGKPKGIVLFHVLAPVGSGVAAAMAGVDDNDFSCQSSTCARGHHGGEGDAIGLSLDAVSHRPIKAESGGNIGSSVAHLHSGKVAVVHAAKGSRSGGLGLGNDEAQGLSVHHGHCRGAGLARGDGEEELKAIARGVGQLDHLQAGRSGASGARASLAGRFVGGAGLGARVGVRRSQPGRDGVHGPEGQAHGAADGQVWGGLERHLGVLDHKAESGGVEPSHAPRVGQGLQGANGHGPALQVENQARRRAEAKHAGLNGERGVDADAFGGLRHAPHPAAHAVGFGVFAPFGQGAELIDRMAQVDHGAAFDDLDAEAQRAAFGGDVGILQAGLDGPAPSAGEHGGDIDVVIHLKRVALRGAVVGVIHRDRAHILSGARSRQCQRREEPSLPSHQSFLESRLSQKAQTHSSIIR